MERFPLRRNDRTAKLGSEPLDSCVASFEVYLILDRWGLSSVRDASVFLGISHHTVEVEASPSHPDGSLRSNHQTRLTLPSPLGVLPFPGEEREPERNELRCSSRILEQKLSAIGEGAEGGEREGMVIDG